ncbi:MAG TPA: hypothetical protein VFQ30_07490, partial [Ktedonobacteraceae bacterium]|nr:hypothetical protein [Ktedonobacteraceae bacterium]
EETAARTLFATHYHELASMAGELPHLRVYTMAISDDDQGGIIFLHRVTPGCIGRSYGVHVAKLAGMPQSIVRRAEEVLKQLEANKQATMPVPLNGYTLTQDPQSERLYATNGNGNELETAHVAEGRRSYWRYQWQSDAARIAAEAFERAGEGEQEPDLDEIDICAITPLDALNLLFIIQKKRSRVRP